MHKRRRLVRQVVIRLQSEWIHGGPVLGMSWVGLVLPFARSRVGIQEGETLHLDALQLTN